MQGKDVAVIGAGSSGIQIVSNLQPKFKSIDHYVRGRTWIAATIGNDLVKERNDGQDGNSSYTKEEIEAWKKHPASYMKYRKALEIGMQGGFTMTHRGTEEHEGPWPQCNQDMRARLDKKPEIAEHPSQNFHLSANRLHLDWAIWRHC